MVGLFHGAKRLGEVPSINLLRICGNVVVRFAGKNWKVKKLSQEGIHVETCKVKKDAVEFSYGGTKPSLDSYIADRMWTLIHTDDLRVEHFSKALSQKVRPFVSAIRKACSREQIPFVRTQEGILYHTFGGYIVNRAIGLFTGKPGFKADDFSLLVPSPVDWSLLPQNPTDYEDCFHLLFEATLAQSIYQKQLPLCLQEHEYLQLWLKDTSIPRILNRLKNAQTVVFPAII